VNAEQTSKRAMPEPTYTTSREGRRKPSTERQGSTGPAGVLAMASRRHAMPVSGRRLRLVVRGSAGAEEATPDLTETHDRGKTEGVNARLKRRSRGPGEVHRRGMPRIVEAWPICPHEGKALVPWRANPCGESVRGLINRAAERDTPRTAAPCRISQAQQRIIKPRPHLVSFALGLKAVEGLVLAVDLS
jgi:hypothetical protein